MDIVRRRLYRSSSTGMFGSGRDVQRHLMVVLWRVFGVIKAKRSWIAVWLAFWCCYQQEHRGGEIGVVKKDVFS